MDQYLTAILAQSAFVLGLALLASASARFLGFSVVIFCVIFGFFGREIISSTAAEELAYFERLLKEMFYISSVFVMFIAGTRVEQSICKVSKSTVVGAANFFMSAATYWIMASPLLGWETFPALFAGIALSAISLGSLGGTNSVNTDRFSAACSINNLLVVIAIGIIICARAFGALFGIMILASAYKFLPITFRFLQRFGAASQTQAVAFILFGSCSIAAFLGFEAAPLVGYMCGIGSARIVGQDGMRTSIRPVEESVEAIFVPFAFVSAGYLATEPVAATQMATMCLYAIIIAFIRALGLYAAVKKWKFDLENTIHSSLIASIGELGVIMTLFGALIGIFNNAQYSSLIFTIAALSTVQTCLAKILGARTLRAAGVSVGS